MRNRPRDRVIFAEMANPSQLFAAPLVYSWKPAGVDTCRAITYGLMGLLMLILLMHTTFDGSIVEASSASIGVLQKLHESVPITHLIKNKVFKG